MELKGFTEYLNKNLKKKAVGKAKFIDGFFQDSIVFDNYNQIITITKAWGFYNVDIIDKKTQKIKIKIKIQVAVTKNSNHAELDVRSLINELTIHDSSSDDDDDDKKKIG